jgi:hypothetical protein
VLNAARCSFAVLLAGCASGSPQQAGPVAVTTGEPIAYERLTVAGPEPQVWHVARLNLRLVRLAVSPGDPGSGSEYRARTTSEALLNNQALMAVNGGFYAVPDIDPAASAAARGSVLDVMGTSIAAGQSFSSPQSGARVITATLCIGQTVTIADGQTCPHFVTDALSAGPLLVRDGQVADMSAQAPGFAGARHPRTALGLDRDAGFAWLVVIDGRQPASVGATLPELAAFMIGLGVDDGINLDGGGSSAMVQREPGGAAGLLSVPIEAGVPGRERAVANHLLVLPKPTR